MLKDIQAVLFDMDGTLIDSMWIWPSIDEDFCNKYGLVMPPQFYEEFEGKSFTDVAGHFKHTFAKLTQTVEEIKAEWVEMAFQKYSSEVSLKPGAGDFLAALQERGIRMGIATSNDRALAEAALEALGIAHYFGSVRTSCEVAQGKPAPDVYLLAASDLGIDPARCLVFEDVVAGIQSGKSAGMRVCAVDDDFSRYQESQKRALADYYIYDYNEITKASFEVTV